jgi:hypothetical protein
LELKATKQQHHQCGEEVKVFARHTRPSRSRKETDMLKIEEQNRASSSPRFRESARIPEIIHNALSFTELKKVSVCGQGHISLSMCSKAIFIYH